MDSRNPVESILRYIPGFRGYLEKEYRRDSDHLARSWMADRLQAGTRTLDEFQRSLLDAGNIDALPLCERVHGRIDTLASRMRGAMRGYSGFFDFVRVDDEVLEDVYQHDMTLVGEVDALVASIDQLRAASDPPDQGLNTLLTRVEDLERRFAERSALLEGLGSGS
jgi:hypothetical protein